MKKIIFSMFAVILFVGYITCVNAGSTSTDKLEKRTFLKVISNFKIGSAKPFINVANSKTVYSNKNLSITNLESTAITDKYIVVAKVVNSKTKRTNNLKKTVSSLTIYDKYTKKHLNTIIDDDLGHANGMAYNNNTNQLVIIHLEDKHKYVLVDASNLATAKKLNKTIKTISGKKLSGVGYDSNKYYFAGSNLIGSNYIYIYDNNMKYLKEIKLHRKGPDINAYNGIIYVTYRKGNNAGIDLYDEKTGNYLGTYKTGLPMSKFEIESVVHYTNDEFLVVGNGFNGMHDAIYKVKMGVTLK